MLPAASGGSKGEPLFTVEATDTVRVFVDVPEPEASLVELNARAIIKVQEALKGQQFVGKVTRTARTLDPKTRTLRTEIDLPSEGKLRPGMYVHVAITATHPNTWNLPATAIGTQGDLVFCYRLEGDQAIRTPLIIGLRDGDWVEVLKKQTKPAKGSEEVSWDDLSGEEKIVGDGASGLKDGQEVRVSPPSGTGRK